MSIRLILLVLVVILNSCQPDDTTGQSNGDTDKITEDSVCYAYVVDTTFESGRLTIEAPDSSYYRLLFAREDAVIAFNLPDYGEPSGIKSLDIDSDGTHDLIIELTSNRSCNYILLVRDSGFVVLDSCSNYPNFTPLNIATEPLFATYANLGCASRVWESKLIQVQREQVVMRYLLSVNECERSTVILTSYTEIDVETDTLNPEVARLTDLQELWRNILSSSAAPTPFP